jgi:hypothetical protein
MRRAQSDDLRGRSVSPRAPEDHHETDLETPQTAPWTGLEAAARAYAKIIDEVNKLPLSTFRRAEESQPTAAQPLPPAAGKLQ